MKKVVISAILFVSVFTASAQLRLNGYAAYTFDDGFDVYSDANSYYYGTLKGGSQFGLGLQYAFNPYSAAEILWVHRSATAPATFKFGVGNNERKETFEVKHDYIMLSGDGLYSKSAKFEGNAGFMAGVLISSVDAPSVNKSGNKTNFAWGGRLGGTVWATPKLGVKLQAMLLSSSTATGGDTYWGYWGPVYLTTYTTLWQFSLGGGLALKLGK